MSICLPLLVFRKWVFVYRHWCEENEMVFVSHEVPFPATSDRRSRVAGNGTECEVKTIELSSPTSGGEQWAFLNLHNFTAVKKTVPKLRKYIFLNSFYGFLNWNESGQIKKRSLFISTGWLRQFNGFYFSLGAISSHSWPSVTHGTSWETKTISFSSHQWR